MFKLTAILSLLFVVACGPSDQEIRSTAAITCNIMMESQGTNAVVRIKEINAARKKIGDDAFLGRDIDILQSFKHGLCQSLVKNDDDYESRLAEQQKQEVLKLAEQQIILASKKEEQEKTNRRRAAEKARIKAAKNQEGLITLTLEEKTTAAEKKSYWKEREERIAATEKIRNREERLVAYWRSLDKTQWEALYPRQTSMQKSGWERCEKMVDFAREACKKNWRKVHDRWKQVVNERMSYSDALKKSDSGRDQD